MNIVGRQVMLRAIELEDVDLVHRWSNDPEVQDNLGGWHFPLSKMSLTKWISGFSYDGRDQRFIIERSADGPVGMVSLTSINWKDRNAFHGVLIGAKQVRRQGIAVDAVLTIMRYAFEELGLRRLDTTIVEFNEPSLRLHCDRCGWEVEGRKEDAVFRRNRFWALHLLGVTAEAYGANRANGRFAPQDPT